MVADDLIQYMDTLEVVDTHEHLPNEADRLKQHVDFSTIFSHYCQGDLTAAGMDTGPFYSPDTEIQEKWRIFEPYYAEIKNGSYARAARLSMERFYGLGDLTCVDDAAAVTELIQAANKPGLYRIVLKDACRLRTSMNFGGMNVDSEFFQPVEFVTHLTEVSSVAELERVGAQIGVFPSTLSDYVTAIGTFLTARKDQGLKALKFHSAYMRDLEFRSITTDDAERVFDRIFEESQGWRPGVLGYNECRPLQDYLTHRIVQFAGEIGLPVVFHTGLQAGNRNRPDNCRPERLWNLIDRYRRTTFILLHSGIPWTDEAGMLAKYFPNVYLDMTWTHIISPEQAESALRTWVDLVPRSRILGFGGDYCVVEKVYGHLQMAKQNIARALMAKIEAGGMSEDDARGWSKAILHDNACAVYGLDDAGA